MRCPNCNSEVPEGKRFCGYCGRRLTPAEASAAPPVPDAFDDDAPTQLVTGETPVEPDGRLEEVQPAPPPQPEEPPEAIPEEPPSPIKRRSRKWAWGIVAVAVVALVAVAVLSSTGRPEPYQPTRAWIDMFDTRDEIRVRADQIVVLGGNVWIADTPELVDEYIVSTHIEITLDGDPLPDPKTYWDETSEWGDYDDDGDADYSSGWQHELGTLSPGTHQIEITVQSNWPVIDGFDSDGDGELDEFDYDYEHRVSIIVEE
jgi:hypothetical protein